MVIKSKFKSISYPFLFFLITLFILCVIGYFIYSDENIINFKPINFETFDDSSKTENKSYDEEKVIFTKPFTLKYYPFFLSQEEINAVLESCKDSFKDSTIIQSKGINIKDNSRTSSSCFIPTDVEKNNELIKNIKQKAAKLSGLSINKIEGLQVVRYEPGQQYKEHYDWFEEGHYEPSEGNRKATFFCYLNDEFDGGETFFPKANFRKKGRKGSALFWNNITENGNVDRNTLHSGLPVNSGTKYGLNIWIR